MNVARSAGEVLAEHTTLELECIDRMYLNVYVPLLQAGAGAAWFFRKVRGNPVPSSALMAPMTNRFVAGLKQWNGSPRCPNARLRGPQSRLSIRHRRSEPVSETTRVGIDLAKKIFHLTAMDDDGNVVERQRLRRAGLQSYLARLPRGCVVAMEACGGAHHWGRLATRHGHQVQLMGAQFVAPYVKSNKSDSLDADAIAEASSRPTMRFVGLKSVEQEHVQHLHRARQLAVRNRTAQTNQIHGMLLEYGIESPKSLGPLLRRLAAVLEEAENELLWPTRALLREMGDELRRVDARVKRFDAEIASLAGQMPACQRLMTIPGVGVMTATALVAAVGDASVFRNGREMAAWLGLVPQQRSTGGRPTLLGISKRGDRYLRTLLIHGARSAIRVAPRRQDRRSRWAVEVAERRGPNLAAVALANKNARTAWALLARGESFDVARTGEAR